MIEASPDYWEKATFLPLDRPTTSGTLLDDVSRSFQTRFLALSLLVSVRSRDLYWETGFAEAVERFKSLRPPLRRRLIQYPPFLIWLKQGFEFSQPSHSNERRTEELAFKLSDLNRVITSFEVSRDAPNVLNINDDRIQIQRFDVDPLLIRAIAPRHRFPDPRRQQDYEQSGGYPLTDFTALIGLALERIKHFWPSAYDDFPQFVEGIIHLVDGDMHSCSGTTFPRVILISTDDRSLLEIEESLIHELGHQILFNVTELDPLIIDETSEVYTLPWSGRKRDLKSYFHALYIYMFLACYFDRVTGRSRIEQQRVIDRKSQIITGLKQALPDFESADKFTARGLSLFENLKSQLCRLCAT